MAQTPPPTDARRGERLEALEAAVIRLDELVSAHGAAIEAYGEVIAEHTGRLGTHGFELARLSPAMEELRGKAHVHEVEKPPRWQDRPDLLPDEGQCVWGVYDGSGEDITDVASALGRVPGLTTLYWKNLTSPVGERVRRELGGQRVVRVDYELTTAFVNAGERREGLWARIAAGEFEDTLRPMLAGAGKLCSFLHEADMDDEAGGGTPQEFAEMWRYLRKILREESPATLAFWNMSGGTPNTRDMWGEAITDEGSTGMFPGRAHVDFVGWDPFCWYGVTRGGVLERNRTSFASAMNRPGEGRNRWEWYKRHFGDRGDPTWRPLMIGETACCEVLPEDVGRIQPADEWIDDMRAWLHDHPDVTHVIWFSVSYLPEHDRRLTGGPEKRAGLERVAADPLFV